MRGAFDRARTMRLEMVAKLPPGSSAALEAPIQMLELWGRKKYEKTGKDRALIAVTDHGRLELPPVQLPANANVPLGVRISVPEAAQPLACEVYVRQLYEEIELGRVTWRLQSPQVSTRRGDERRRPHTHR
jgi:hypothetical protein